MEPSTLRGPRPPALPAGTLLHQWHVSTHTDVEPGHSGACRPLWFFPVARDGSTCEKPHLPGAACTRDTVGAPEAQPAVSRGVSLLLILCFLVLSIMSPFSCV